MRRNEKRSSKTSATPRARSSRVTSEAAWIASSHFVHSGLPVIRSSMISGTEPRGETLRNRRSARHRFNHDGIPGVPGQSVGKSNASASPSSSMLQSLISDELHVGTTDEVRINNENRLRPLCRLWRRFSEWQTQRALAMAIARSGCFSGVFATEKAKIAAAGFIGRRKEDRAAIRDRSSSRNLASAIRLALRILKPRRAAHLERPILGETENRSCRPCSVVRVLASRASE